jgi:hypothetical protein
MIATLSCFAGYGTGFFSAHSGRMGFACRKTAEHLSQGKTLQELFDNLAIRGHWAFGSKTVVKYCKTNVSRFFEGEHPLTWDQFQLLEPEVLHDLHALDKVSIRSNTWFCHPPDQLLSLLHDVGLPDTILEHDQSFVRKRIAQRMFAFDDRFQMFVMELAKTREKADYYLARDLAITVISILLEYEHIGYGRSFATCRYSEMDFVDRILKSMEDQPRGDRHEQSAVLNRQTRVHRVINLDEAFGLADRLKRHRVDRQANVALLEDGREYIINHPARESRTHLAVNLPRLPDDHNDNSLIELRSPSSRTATWSSSSSDSPENRCCTGLQPFNTGSTGIPHD